MIEPRWYQKELIEGTRDAWAAGAQNVLIVSPPRSGKTKTAVWLSEPFIKAGMGVCIQAHREELVRQIAMEYAEFGYEHSLLASSDVVSSIIHRQVKELGRSFVRQNALVTVGSVQTILSRAKTMTQWAARIGLWITDECFPAGTLVDGVPIENLRVGDEVTAFDEETGQTVKRQITRTFANPMPDYMVRVDIAHHVVHATPAHPFWTKRGWVNAKDLNTTDEVLVDDLSRMSVTCESTEVNNVSLQKDRSSILQRDVFECVSGKNIIGNGIPNQSETCVCADEGKQSDVKGCVTTEDDRDVAGDEAWSESPRRERCACNQSREHADVAVQEHGLCGTACCSDWTFERVRPTTLQNRLRTTEPEDSNRGRRDQSSGNCQTRIRSAQRPVLEWSRVEGVSILKRDNPELARDSMVYNIEVDRNHTYLANGVVVHNCHHLGRQDSQWGKVVAMFPNARGAGFTATPARTDRVSLDRKQGGVFDVMVKGVTARQLIDEGYICDYRIIAPPSSIDRAAIKVGGSGDFTQTGLVEAQKHSTITGDCVASYLRFTPGEQAVAFAVDIGHATEMCDAYRAAGVKAEAISSKTPSAIRKQLMDKFERGVFQVLCNVDLFGEGLNVKSITVVIMARPTQSFVLFVQQFFRALTSDHGKKLGTIIDHAGNVGFFGRIYGLPDSYNRWTLFAEERGKKQVRDPDVIPLTTCTACFQAYPAIHRACPFCGHSPDPTGRSRPEQVDGDLIELDAATLAAMRGEASRIDGEPQIPFGASEAVAGAVRKRWRERQEAQATLRHEIALWAGVWRDRGDTDSMIYRRFFFRFDTDIMTAQGLGRAEADELKERITHALAHT